MLLYDHVTSQFYFKTFWGVPVLIKELLKLIQFLLLLTFSDFVSFSYPLLSHSDSLPAHRPCFVSHPPGCRAETGTETARSDCLRHQERSHREAPQLPGAKRQQLSGCEKRHIAAQSAGHDLGCWRRHFLPDGSHHAWAPTGRGGV